MLKYIKKFYSYITGDDETVAKTQKEYRNDSSHEMKDSNETEMKARVSYQYPKGNFRFPLIADSEVNQKGKRRPKRQTAEQQPVSTISKAPSTRSVRKKQTNRVTEPTKVKEVRVSSGPFKATEVPSPVYGFKERTYQTPNNEPIEFELPDTSSNITLENEENTYVNDQYNTHEEMYENVPQNEETKMYEEIEKDVEEVVERTSFSRDVEEEEVSSYLAEEVKEEVYIPSTPITSQEDEEKNRSRNPVPFNVVMLKQDREKLNQKPKETTVSSGYQFPPLHYLTNPKHDVFTDEQWLEEQKELLDVTLENFNVRAKVVNVTQGPSVTRFEVHPEPGVKVNKITNLSDDIKLSLSARDIRMEAPIPGKNTIGIEVPNKVSKPVLLSEIINSGAFRNNPSPLTVALGLDISGKPIITDLKKMPHGLIAGATGSGKSVCINAMLVSLLYKASPDQVKLLLIDPKMVELAPYNDIPHLVSPVITDVKAATAALKWAVEEMERRYERFAHSGVRDINRYNELVREHNERSGEMPFLVIIIDELADLMMVAPGEVEESICRIAQKARACGIHLVLATQRPSVDVITGLIKANVPTRIAFSVSSQVDSRTIIDVSGAEKLLGKGDMLLLENGSSKSVRLQGNFVSDQEIEKIVAFVKERQKPEYLFHQQDLVSKSNITQEEDELFNEACEFVIEQGGASSSLLQRKFRIGYNRAARLVEMMEEYGIVSEQRGSKPRDVLITADEWLELQEMNSTTTS